MEWKEIFPDGAPPEFFETEPWGDWGLIDEKKYLRALKDNAIARESENQDKI